ncbi:TrkH family potassium uptake protein [Limnoraphis robusta]|uniref:ATPase n=1 Tax=Limnoraphis robusta CS-951 TaxID=1637645 RepID=A0A0F5YAT4_9CYAN|nr:TrkH family potassium uptake protein [Limnoraphis robusta]KKD35335.1 ATPase [Limnoraphis robusta CS-951]
MTISRTICLGFLAVITAGTLLLLMPFSYGDEAIFRNPIATVVTALFTATSAVCVTGLSVVNVGEYYSFWGQFIMLLLVEVGGLGYMTATTILLLLIGRKFGLRDKLALQQTLDTSGLGGVVSLVQSIIATTILFQLTGVLLLLMVFVPDYGLNQGLWLSIFHSVNGFNNAGFSLFADSLIQYVTSPLLNLTLTGLIIFGGLGYQVIIELYLWMRERLSRNRCHREFSLHFKIVTTTNLFLLIVGTVLIFSVEFQNVDTLETLTFPQKIMTAWFQSVTTRTAGFNTIDIGSMTAAGLFVTNILMFIGASPGSTGGGIKTTTARILLRCTRATLQGRDEVLCYQRKIPAPLILKAVSVLVGSSIVVFVSTLLVSLFQSSLEFEQILFEIVSAFATVGLSTGITGSLSLPSQLVVIATMYIGRVGVLLLMLAIVGDPKPTSVEYPEENLLVG